MSNKLRAFFLSLTIFAIVMWSAFGTTATAYADDGAPPASTETVVPPDGSGGTSEVTDGTSPPVDVTPVATEEPVQPADPTATEEPAQPGDVTPVATEESQQPADGTSAPTDAAVSPPDPAATEPPAQPILEQLPDNTTITVLNSDGEPQPLATQASADAIDSAYDPIWCPEGQTPTPGQNGCTDSFASLDELLTYLQTHETDAAFQQAGTIYIQQGQYLGGESSINFNNYTFNSLNNYNLTLQGGWNTTNNTVDPAATTDFNAPLTIGSSSNPWVGSLTFNGINISNVNGQAGLTVYTNANVTLNNVEVTSSQSGASLDAGGDVTIHDSNFNQNQNHGANIHAGGNVQITNSTFNQNGSFDGTTGKGLEVNGGGNVSLVSVEANNNQAFGANIDTSGDVTITNSFFSGNVEYRYYCVTCTDKFAIGGYGLQVVTTGNITADGITADNNYFFGANLSGNQIMLSNGSFSNNGTGRLEESEGYGLQINSTGLLGVTLANITADNNEKWGANITADGDVVILNSFFDGNKSYTWPNSGKTYYGYGLQVVTTGVIVLDTVSASNNNLFGASLSGDGVDISGGIFNNNGTGSSAALLGQGLTITSASNVNLANVSANNNQAYGADITATGNVTIDGSFFNGQLGYGLNVVTSGRIALSNLEATDNYLYGAHVEGSTVTIDMATFSHNGSGAENNPTGYGLEVISSGVVALANVEANYNQLFGANIQAVGDVTIFNSFFSHQQSFSFDPVTHQFTYYGYGLQVSTTAGTMSLDGVEANFNNLWGGSLTGIDINIANSKFNNNVTDSQIFIDDTGLLVESTGTVSLDNVEAKENRLIGASIHTTGDVFINNSIFSGNQGTTCNNTSCTQVTTHGYGLNVDAGGMIELNAVQANNNNLFGANLHANGDITVFSSFFNGNQYTTSDGTLAGYGLQVVSTNGNIFLGPGQNSTVGVTASGNGAEGTILVGNGTITVINSTFTNNGGDGLNISANGGNVTLTNVTATGNGGDGVDVTGVCTNTLFVNGGTFAQNGLFGISANNIIYAPDGTQTFSGNSSGNVFQDPTCVAVPATNTSTGSGTVVVASPNNNTGTGTGTVTNGGQTNGHNQGPRYHGHRHHRAQRHSHRSR